MRQGSLCGMLRGTSSKRHMYREGGCTVVRQGHFIAVVGTFLIGCAVLLLMVGCAGTSSETSKKEQEPTEATREQTRSAKAASEEARCAETRIIDLRSSVVPADSDEESVPAFPVSPHES